MFWLTDPEMWLAQLKNEFGVTRVKADETKFNYIASNMDSKYAVEVRGTLTKLQSSGKYEKLKTELM